MKNFLRPSVFFVISLFLVTSCDPWEDESYHPGGDSDENVIIPGGWKLTELNLDEPYDFNQDGTANKNLMIETNCYNNELISFLPNNTGVITSNSYAQITADSESIDVECIEELDETNFTWSQTQNTVSIIAGGQTLTATLSGNKLTYIIPEGFYTGETGEGGVEILQDITFIYTKQ